MRKSNLPQRTVCRRLHVYIKRCSMGARMHSAFLSCCEMSIIHLGVVHVRTLLNTCTYVAPGWRPAGGHVAAENCWLPVCSDTLGGQSLKDSQLV